MTTSIPFQQQQPAFGRVANIAELVRMTPEELNKYNISIDSYRTHLAIMKNERAEGRAEGRAEEKVEIAKQMIAIGMPVKQICAVTKLSISEVCALRQ